ncbi:uncharacterized protein LOC111699580 [Eurytemora carolleeae]|uniref:uncharacterized protein LOC111699580 n=1 Tax=Eurytemora carolleeae TaxID=1294199 RepID=UPI000C76483E|nr:uncharacterized protein LOC111699580 [Eurytemora carolleeae]|eukprot:XP_023326053.1 uncharacterized protein LOC111699580 [Eurytemora affinis]
MENKLSGLESMVVYDLMVVLKYLTKKDKGSLRASSTTLLRRIDELEKNTFKVWRIHGEVDSSRLKRLSDEIRTIQELAIYTLITPGCGPAFNYLVEKHEELESIRIGFVKHENEYENKDQDEIVLRTLSHNNLKSITIYGMKNTGDITGRLPSTLPNLEKLQLTADCDELSNGGLVEILRISGSKLRYLDVSWTSVTGVGFKDGVKSLPMLENLKLVFCDELTEEGLQEILSTAGNRLKILCVNGERISAVCIETLRILLFNLSRNL